MKVLYLFNRIHGTLEEGVRNGTESDNSFFGMYRLARHGAPAEFLELEQRFSPRFASFIRRKIFNIHYVHLPFFFAFRKYDIVFTSTAFGSLLLKAVLGLRRPKWVMFDFSIAGMIGHAKTLKQKVFRFMIGRGADGIVAISQKEADRIKAIFPKLASRIIFLPLGTDTEFWKPTGVPRDGGVLSIGRDPYRDFGTLLSAVKGLSEPVTVITKPQNLAPFLPLPENVSTKMTSTEELRNEYSRAKIFVLPLRMKDNLNEAVGTSTLVEAMAMGCAIVATRTFTMESYIKDGENGILVPEGDAEALRRAIEELLSDQQKRERLGAAAREFVLKNCDAEKFAGSLAYYFKSL